jgi:hypothetical protein
MNTGSGEPAARPAPPAEGSWRGAAGEFSQTAARRVAGLESGIAGALGLAFHDSADPSAGAAPC